MKPRAKALKTEFSCKDGPFKGYTLYLGSSSTLIFTYLGQTGRYIIARTGILKWEPV